MGTDEVRDYKKEPLTIKECAKIIANLHWELYKNNELKGEMNEV